MKKQILLTMLSITILSCEDKTIQEQSVENKNYTEESTNKLNSLKSPVVIIGINKTWCCYGITVVDSVGYILDISANSNLANSIGQSRKVGDTIR
jgi:endo-1,4-beta-D-glucanase Y